MSLIISTSAIAQFVTIREICHSYSELDTLGDKVKPKSPHTLYVITTIEYVVRKMKTNIYDLITVVLPRFAAHRDDGIATGRRIATHCHEILPQNCLPQYRRCHKKTLTPILSLPRFVTFIESCCAPSLARA